MLHCAYHSASAQRSRRRFLLRACPRAQRSRARFTAQRSTVFTRRQTLYISVETITQSPSRMPCSEEGSMIVCRSVWQMVRTYVRFIPVQICERSGRSHTSSVGSDRMGWSARSR